MNDLVARAVERFGRLDVMICNAGFGIYGAIDDITPEQMHKLVDVNYFGTYYATRAALPVFRRQGAGHVIIVSSIVGKRGVPVHGRVLGDQVRAGRARRVPALRARGLGHPRQRRLSGFDDTEFIDVMLRETGSRHHAVRGPRQTAEQVADAIAGAIARPGAGGLPVHEIARPRAAERDRARLLRSAREEIRPPAGKAAIARERGLAQP